MERGACTGSIAHGWAPVGVHQLNVPLAPGERRSFIFELGYVENPPRENWAAPGVVEKSRARAMLAVGGEEPKDESTMAKMSAKMGVKMQTAMDKSNTNLAKMIIEGSHMGEKDMEEAIRQNPGANVGAVALAKRLHHAESEYAQQMKNFL